jgi:hypothetical protein
MNLERKLSHLSNLAISPSTIVGETLESRVLPTG